MPFVKRTAAGRISTVFDRPSRDAKERVRANDPELLKFLGLAPTQSVDTPPVDAVVESYDYAEPQIDAPYIPPPDYDDALYDESQEFVKVGEDSAAAFEPAPAPNVPLEQEATNEDVGTEFSLPDDIPHDSFENDEFSGGFDLEGVDSAHTWSNHRAASEIAEASEAEAPVFESGDIPSGTSSPETAPPPSLLLPLQSPRHHRHPPNLRQTLPMTVAKRPEISTVQPSDNSMHRNWRWRGSPRI